MKKILKTALFSTVLSLSLAVVQIPAGAEEAGRSDDIVILYTNDVHCGIDTNIGYDGLALYKREMQEKYKNVLLVDAGDAIQGMPIGTLSNGKYITQLMNAVGYDAAVPGNHEFDYTVAELMVRADELNCGYICANLYSNETNDLLFEPYKLIEAGDKTVAFVGATTPETLSSSTPVYFQNDSGEFIYTFGEKGDLYKRLQDAVDGAKSEGADYVILLAHVGENWITEGWSAPEIAGNLTGIDAIIDGHSHEVTPSLKAKTKDGKDIVITQTGTKLENIGKMTITPDGKITTELINSVPTPGDDSAIPEDTWLEPDGREGRFVDEAVNRLMLRIESEFSTILDREIGVSEYELTDKDPKTGLRRVRNGETNLGDLCADAYKYVLETDVSIVNGGGIRASMNAGKITYKDAMTVFPFANIALTAEVTGQQILDMLETGAKDYPGESGSFIHAAGIEYTIDESIESGVKLSDEGEFLGVDGEYRVKDVMINGKPLDTEKTYSLASHNYFLKNGGDGWILSGKCKILRDDVMTDSEVLSVYIRDTLGGVIPEKYSDPYGDGRIKTVNAQTADSDDSVLKIEAVSEVSECFVGDQFTVTVTLTNTGKDALSNITAYLEDTPVYTAETLAAGEEVKLAVKLNATEEDIAGGTINISSTADELADAVRTTLTVKVSPTDRNPSTGVSVSAAVILVLSIAATAATRKRR